MTTVENTSFADTIYDSDMRRWQAVVLRDRKADGRFFYAVSSTGIFCRPGCGARRPRRDNVSFFATVDAARNAGFRPCKRCTPDLVGSDDPIARACAIVRDAAEPPTLAALSAAVGLSPFHFHRRFKAAVGVTPKAFIDARRAGRVRAKLCEGGSIISAAYEAGYGSSSRFYEAVEGRLGMKPTVYRSGGQGLEICYAFGRCSLGVVLVAGTRSGICAIELADDEVEALASLQQRFRKAQLTKAGAAFSQMVKRAIAAVERPETAAALPLDVQGTAFQEQVWQALQAIPEGKTATYAGIAKSLGRPAATRAVATAIAANPLAVVVPCHRVVRSDHALGGYRWGLERKRALLARERKVKAVKS